MPVTATLVNTDCFDAFATLEDDSIDAVITDPPYFLDQLGDTWSTDKEVKNTKSGQVTSLPAGMKFDPKQGIAFQEFMHNVALEAMRVLKPGGALLSFSAPRLYHRLAVAVEDAGFHVRDMWSWLYTQNQVKAMSVERFVDTSNLTDEEIEQLKTELSVWKTPQIKSCLEPIVFGQKPPDGTFAKNWLAHRTGLVNTSAKVGEHENMVPANVLTTGWIDAAFDRAFLVPKPSRAERGDTSHISVKPLALMDQLVRLVTPAGATVLDPFNGSGSTGISALRTGRNYVGFELSGVYFTQTIDRFTSAFDDEKLTFRADDSAGYTVASASIEPTRLTEQAH